MCAGVEVGADEGAEVETGAEDAGGEVGSIVGAVVSSGNSSLSIGSCVASAGPSLWVGSWVGVVLVVSSGGVSGVSDGLWDSISLDDGASSTAVLPLHPTSEINKTIDKIDGSILFLIWLTSI